MPAEFESGFFVRKPAWHGLGVVLEDYPGRETAMRLAGHNWHVVKAPVLVPGYVVVGEQDCEEYGEVRRLHGWKALMRDDTSIAIAVVKESYEVVQNDVMWDIVGAMVQEPNVKYETAGVLRGGAILWVLAKLDEPTVIPGDNSEIYPYVHVSTTHDGSGAVRGECVSVRVVCANTYMAARNQSEQTGLYYSFRHSKNVMERIDEAREALGLVRDQHGAFVRLSVELAKVHVTDSQVKDFLRGFLPDPPAAVTTERAVANVEQARQMIDEILMGPTIADAHRRTAYGLWQSGIEYLDHGRAFRSAETHFKRTVRPQPAKMQLARLALKVSTG